MDFSKKLKFLFLVNLNHFNEHYEVRKDGKSQMENEILELKNAILSLPTPFWEVCKIVLKVLKLKVSGISNFIYWNRCVYIWHSPLKDYLK